MWLHTFIILLLSICRYMRIIKSMKEKNEEQKKNYAQIANRIEELTELSRTISETTER